MAGRRFVVGRQHSADELFARYRAEREGRRTRRWQVLWLLRQGKARRLTAALVGTISRTVQSKILFIAFSCFFPIYLNTAQGVRFTDPLLIRAARSLGASQLQLFVDVILRAALPEIMTGLRLGFGMALFVLVAAELIAADAGLGYRIQEARNMFQVDVMFLSAFAIGVLGFTLGTLLRWLQSYILRWKAQIN